MTKLVIEQFLEWVATLPDGVCEEENEIELAREAFMAGRESAQQSIQRTADGLCECGYNWEVDEAGNCERCGLRRR